MTEKTERRTLSAPVELRDAGDGKRQVITGYAAIFNSETDICGCFREKIAPGAFAKSIAGGDIRGLFNHDTSLVLGRTKSGTLRLKEDERGLNYEIDPPDTQVARDLAESMGRGDVDGSSFAFLATREEWDETGDIPLRTILEAELYEVSVVTFPAYEDSLAEVAMRSLEALREERQREQSRLGFARRKADAVRERSMEHKLKRFPAQPEA